MHHAAPEPCLARAAPRSVRVMEARHRTATPNRGAAPPPRGGGAAAAPYDPPTVPELMDRFGLPRVLLPDTAHRYLLHDDSSFQLFLDDGCVVEVGGYRVGYDVELSGAVAPGQVTGIEGVRVLFAWVPITAVEVGSGEVIVSLGLLKKSFPAVRFKSSPPCIAGVATTDS